MLKLVIPSAEVFDESDSTFKVTKEVGLTLEHSLVSVSKWESKWCVPFLSKSERTSQQTLDYIKCMTLTQNIDDAFNYLSQANVDAIKQYIDAPMTATVITERNKKVSREIITSEIIYYWMVALNIPFECQKWHLNRLLMLINVCSIKQEKPQKMPKGKALKSQAALNAQRKAMLNSNG